MASENLAEISQRYIHQYTDKIREMKSLEERHAFLEEHPRLMTHKILEICLPSAQSFSVLDPGIISFLDYVMEQRLNHGHAQLLSEYFSKFTYLTNDEDKEFIAAKVKYLNY